MIAKKGNHALAFLQRNNTSGSIRYHESPASLADLAYHHNYSDQMHLTKEFKSYTGLSPAVFLSRHDNVKEKLFKGK